MISPRNIKMMNFSWLYLTFKSTCWVVTAHEMSTEYTRDLKNIEVIHGPALAGSGIWAWIWKLVMKVNLTLWGLQIIILNLNIYISTLEKSEVQFHVDACRLLSPRRRFAIINFTQSVNKSSPLCLIDSEVKAAFTVLQASRKNRICRVCVCVCVYILVHVFKCACHWYSHLSVYCSRIYV